MQQRKKGDRQTKGGEYEEESHGKARRLDVEEGEQPGQRKNRRNGSETLLVFLCEKTDRESVFKEEELAFRQRQQGEEKRHEAFGTQQSAIQTQHKKIVQLMYEENNWQQQQVQNAQMMMQLQQQQTQKMMSLLEILANKAR